MINHTLKLMRLTKIAVMDTKSYVVTMTNTQNQHKYIEVRMSFINSWKKMLYEVNYCKKVMRNNFNKPLKMTNEDASNKPINAIYVIKIYR